ncbi:MAG: RNA 2',3'-cyclic phosphodiesterase [Verrucomicrobiota bacterium]|nr:RNA 2',3'-cyclic phosphodiesterase [Verrucomicrobiota bacterium]
MADAIAQQLSRFDPHLRGVRWMSAEQIHLTLGFFGNVSAEVEQVLVARLREIEFKAFFLPLVGFGTFLAKGWPNLIWVGVGAGHPHLFQVHKRVQEAALAAGLEPDLRSFHPHFTVARCRDVPAESIRQFLQTNADLDAGMIRVEAFELNSSRPEPGGSIYTTELIVRAA